MQYRGLCGHFTNRSRALREKNKTNRKRTIKGYVDVERNPNTKRDPASKTFGLNNQAAVSLRSESELPLAATIEANSPTQREAEHSGMDAKIGRRPGPGTARERESLIRPRRDGQSIAAPGEKKGKNRERQKKQNKSIFVPPTDRAARDLHNALEPRKLDVSRVVVAVAGD